MHQVDRRAFLEVAGAAFLGAACTPYKSPTERRIAAAPPSPEPILQGKERMIKEINDLSPSIVRDLLVERVSPYFQNQPPFTLHRSDFELKVHDSTVIAQNGKPGENSQGYLMFPADNKSEQFRFRRSGIAYLPLLEILNNGEGEEFIKTSDGTSLYTAPYGENQGFFEGIWPIITIRTRQPMTETTPANESFLYIKEACSLLFYDIRIEEVYKKMSELKLPTTVEAIGTNGRLTYAEIVSGLNHLAYENGGRYLATLDLGGYLLAVKTGKVGGATSENDLLSSARQVNLGSSPQSVLYNTQRWAINTPFANQLSSQKIIQGKMDKLP